MKGIPVSLLTALTIMIMGIFVEVSKKEAVECQKCEEFWIFLHNWLIFFICILIPYITSKINPYKLRIQSIYHIRHHLLIIFIFAKKNNPKVCMIEKESSHEALTSWINKVAQQAFTVEGKSLSSTKEKWQSECKCRIRCRVLLQSLFIKITAGNTNLWA